MTREEAIEVYNGLINQKIKEAFEFFAPELAESEDERIRKWLITSVKDNMADCWFDGDTITREMILAWLEKQKEQKPLKVGENAFFDPNTDRWFIKKEQKPAEDKELLKNILFQKKGITYDDYKCKNDPYVGLSFYELIKCLEEYDKARSNR